MEKHRNEPDPHRPGPRQRDDARSNPWPDRSGRAMELRERFILNQHQWVLSKLPFHVASTSMPPFFMGVSECSGISEGWATRGHLARVIHIRTTSKPESWEPGQGY